MLKTSVFSTLFYPQIITTGVQIKTEVQITTKRHQNKTTGSQNKTIAFQIKTVVIHFKINGSQFKIKGPQIWPLRLLANGNI